MKLWRTLTGISALAVAAVNFALPVSANAPEATGELEFRKIAGYSTGAGLEEAGAEIVQYDAASQKVYLINGAASSLEIVDLSALETGVADQALNVDASAKIAIPALSPEDRPDLFGDVTSVAVHPTEDLIAVAVPNSVKTDNGSVVFFTKDGAYIDYVEVGALPDMITVTPDGTQFLVANEGEPNDDYSIDPEGSVSIIGIAKTDGKYSFDVTTADFADESLPIDDNVRYGSLKTGYVEEPTPEQWAADFEPEYIVVAEDSQTAYVALQESNAIATLDLETMKFTKVSGLGYKNYMLPDNALDPSDRDPEDDPQINIQSGYPVLGAYMPDGMALKTIGGKTYLFTANEGDSRDWGVTDEYRFKDIMTEDGPEEGYAVHLDAKYYPGTSQEELDALNLGELSEDEYLGRLKIIGSVSDAVYKDEAEDVHYFGALYTYGGRSFSIWDAETGRQVYDSGDDFERIAAAELPELFNSDHASNAKDDRSDDKGPEPEYVEIGVVGDETYAFVGLERQSALMVYNVSNPDNPQFVTFVNMRDVGESGAGDLGPEGLDFIPAANSPTGKPLLLTGNEVSGTLAVFEISELADRKPFALNAVADDTTYTVSNEDGKVAMTVKAGVTGWKTFGAAVTADLGHEGSETVLFKHSRGNQQLGLSAVRADFDSAPLEVQAQFNVKAGDTVEIYVVDGLSNDPDQQPIVLQ